MLYKAIALQRYLQSRHWILENHFSQPRCSISMVRSIAIIQPKRKRWNGPGPNGTQRPPSSDSSVQTSSQTQPPKPPKPPPQFRFTMAMMACPKTWWNLHPVKTTRNTMGEIGNFQELMNAWKKSLWCWETPTRQSIMQHFGDWEKIDKQTYQKN